MAEKKLLDQVADALRVKHYSWQYVFPASVRSTDPISKQIKRHSL